MTPYDYRKIAFLKEDIENFRLRTVYLGLTDLCNHDCAWCFTRMSRRKFNATLDEKVFEQLVEDMKTLGVKGVILSGEGEPTMCPYFGKALLQLTQHFAVGLKTNGGLLYKYNGKVLERLKFLRVSLDAFTKEEHERGHGAKDWDAIINFIETYEGDNLQVGHLTDDMYDKIFERFPNTDIVPRTFHKDRKPEHIANKCYAARSMCHIAPNGDVMTCCTYTPLESRYTIGNTKKTRLTKSWGSTLHKDAVKSIRPKDCPAHCIYHKKNWYYENRDKLHLEFV